MPGGTKHHWRKSDKKHFNGSKSYNKRPKKKPQLEINNSTALYFCGLKTSQENADKPDFKHKLTTRFECHIDVL